MITQQINNRILIVLTLVGQLINLFSVSAHTIGDPAHDGTMAFAAKSSKTTITPNFYTPPAGNGTLMVSSFTPFKPKVRFYWDSTYFYEESDGFPDRTLMPTIRFGMSAHPAS